MTADFWLEDLRDRPAWQEEALCAQSDPEAWYPEQGGSTLEAKRICQSCPVRTECLTAALANQERFGIWGGHSERERRKLTKGIAVVPNLTHGGNRKYELTGEQELDLMDLLSQGWTQGRIAEHFHISKTAVSRVRNRHFKQNGAAA